jgi:serine/threonine-protein kinase
VGRQGSARNSELPLEGRIGSYRLVRRIGKGGMGSVYEARTELGRRIAIKILHEQYLESDDLIARFLREARSAASVRHPRIVDVFDVGWSEDGQFPYFAMELLEGITVDDLMRDRTEGVDVDLAVRIVSQVLEAVDAAHDRAVVHRDLKPGNVFLEGELPDVDVKVLDFGISKVLGDEQVLTRAGQVLGTPAYMSPEQATGGPVDRRTDVYSAGALLYELLSGAPPFSGSVPEVLAKKSTTDPPPLASLRADVPQGLLVAVARAMQRSPGRRYRSAGEMRAAILAAHHVEAVEPPRDLLGDRGLDRPTPLSWEVTALLPHPDEPLLPAQPAWSQYEVTKRSKRFAEKTEEPVELGLATPPSRWKSVAVAALSGVVAGAIALGAVWLLDADPPPPTSGFGQGALVSASPPPGIAPEACRLHVVVAPPGTLELDGLGQGTVIDRPLPCGARRTVRATAPGHAPREMEIEATVATEPIRIELSPAR